MVTKMATGAVCTLHDESENNECVHLPGSALPAPAKHLLALLRVVDGVSELGDLPLLNLNQLRELVFHGACEGAGVPARPIAWRVLLGVLDDNRVCWLEQLANRRREYQSWKREFLGRGCHGGSRPIYDVDEPHSDSASGLLSSSQKASYEHDVALLKEIDKVRFMTTRECVTAPCAWVPLS